MQFLKIIVLILLFFSSAPLVYAAITAQQVAIVVNMEDADSRLIADYYQKKRNIPLQNIIKISMSADKKTIDEKKFTDIYQQVLEQTPGNVQYYALAWSKPFKVGCMSITSAFTFGFDSSFCAKGCKQTRMSNYYNSNSGLPSDELQIRPSMMLAGSSLQQVYEMIDRGVAADGSQPEATAYLMSTSDKARNVRSRRYRVIKELLSEQINIKQVDSDILENKDDVMFYFTGLKKVRSIESNQYLPGAIADHLTSSGGNLFGRKQMSLLRWLDAGATASYGTVVEPCAFTQKFPNPGIVIERYTNGESLIEAYWKSVAWPGQGLFVGEPMASPYAVQ
ncbi:MAG: TIGR03790 family protein [Gammaproteobacteria bacterium]|nr:TIGR03790 family protein [Gammaproteobacteria bacterium]MBT8132933.1 TIGR03790 family protein [Gammaproteobacteria bacterium]NNJ51132.1 TIGR03790 family protein [Gammaproteobacteria bacterium]